VEQAGLSDLSEHLDTFVLAAHTGIVRQWFVPRPMVSPPPWVSSSCSS